MLSPRTYLGRLSITKKLTLVIMVTSAVVLLLVSGLFVGFEWHQFRQALSKEQIILGRIIGANSAASLLFDDGQQASRVLETLKTEPRVRAACIYRADYTPLAKFESSAQAKWPGPKGAPEGTQFQGDQIMVFLPVLDQNERIGTVYVLADASEMSERLVHYAGIVFAVLCVALVIALGLSSLLTRVISRPVLALADAAREVSQRRDYTLRAPKFFDDDVGRLTDAFNEMLAQIQSHDATLKAEIVERTAAETKLRETAARLEASNRELQDFAYVASHDLQEPLRKIQAFGDRLRSKFTEALGETGGDYLTRMSDAASRMQTLITDLLSFSRVTTKAQPFVPVDLNQIATGVMSDLEVRIEQTKASVEIGALVSIDADPLQMRQLFQNLIGNALKFGKAGVPPRIQVTGVTRNGSTPPRLELVFRDNGIGFDQKYAERIFVIFQRLHGRGEYEGTGIGLAICKKIVERHGGVINATSVPGEGATFTIQLPVYHNQTVHSHQAKGVTKS